MALQGNHDQLQWKSTTSDPAVGSCHHNCPWTYMLDGDAKNLIFEFVGTGYYRFIGNVSRSWNKRYLQVHRKKRYGGQITFVKNLATSSPGCFLYYAEEDELLSRTALRESDFFQTAMLQLVEAGEPSILQMCQSGKLPVSDDKLSNPLVHEVRSSLFKPMSDDMITSVGMAAAKGGHLAIIIWLAHHHGLTIDDKLCLEAAEAGHFDVLEWVEQCDAMHWRCRSWVPSFAATKGCLDLLMWCKARGYQLDSETCSIAAGRGHLRLLKWARANGCDWKGDCASHAAAIAGHYDLLKWALKNGCPLCPEICSTAASYGHLRILQLAREYECKWGKSVCFVAAQEGYTELFKWAVSNGCPWDSSWCCQVAIKEGHVGVLEFVANCKTWPAGSELLSNYLTITGSGHWSVLKWAIDKGFDLGWNAFDATSSNSFQRWAAANNYHSCVEYMQTHMGRTLCPMKRKISEIS